MIEKNTWIRNILFCVKDFANKEYQQRAWVQHKVYIPCSFGEMMCKLFDDCFIEEFLKEKVTEFNLTKEQKNTLSNLVQALDTYGDNPAIYTYSTPPRIDEAKMLSDPEWHQIQKMAQEVLESFKDMTWDLEAHKEALDCILGGISRYADTDRQIKMWVERKVVFYSTPYDLYDGLFRYGDFDDFLENSAKSLLSQEQIIALNEFRNQLKKTPFKTAEFEGILDNSDWKKIQALAKQTLSKFPPS